MKGFVGAGLVIVLLVSMAAAGVDAAVLGVARGGEGFTIDGKPAYMLGMSYYGAASISTPSFLTKDLDEMAGQGFNWIRVWAFWDPGDMNVSVLNPDGSPREPYLSRLKTVIRECNRRGMIVDVTFGRGAAPFPSNQAEHLACVRTLARELKPYRNAYFDVGNERDVRDARYVSYEDMGALISAIKEIDPKRLCTASGVPGSAEDMRRYVEVGRCDFVAPHLGRDRGSAAQTVETVRRMIGWMSDRRVPILLQEPFRRDYAPYQPTESDYLRDAGGGKVAGAAGWCLHNGSDREGKLFRSFRMSDADGRLYRQLDDTEQRVARLVSQEIGGASADVVRYQAEYEEQVGHSTGERRDWSWTATAGRDKAGALASISLPAQSKSRLRVVCRVWTAPSGSGTAVGTLRLIAGGKAFAQKELRASDYSSGWRLISLEAKPGAGPVECRLDWGGGVDMRLDWVEVGRR